MKPFKSMLFQQSEGIVLRYVLGIAKQPINLLNA